MSGYDWELNDNIPTCKEYYDDWGRGYLIQLYSGSPSKPFPSEEHVNLLPEDILSSINICVKEQSGVLYNVLVSGPIEGYSNAKAIKSELSAEWQARQPWIMPVSWFKGSVDTTPTPIPSQKKSHTNIATSVEDFSDVTIQDTPLSTLAKLEEGEEAKSEVNKSETSSDAEIAMLAALEEEIAKRGAAAKLEKENHALLIDIETVAPNADGKVNSVVPSVVVEESGDVETKPLSQVIDSGTKKRVIVLKPEA